MRDAPASGLRPSKFLQHYPLACSRKPTQLPGMPSHHSQSAPVRDSGLFVNDLTTRCGLAVSCNRSMRRFVIVSSLICTPSFRPRRRSAQVDLERY